MKPALHLADECPIDLRREGQILLREARPGTLLTQCLTERLQEGLIPHRAGIFVPLEKSAPRDISYRRS